MPINWKKVAKNLWGRRPLTPALMNMLYDAVAGAVDRHHAAWEELNRREAQLDEERQRMWRPLELLIAWGDALHNVEALDRRRLQGVVVEASEQEAVDDRHREAFVALLALAKRLWKAAQPKETTTP